MLHFNIQFSMIKQNKQTKTEIDFVNMDDAQRLGLLFTYKTFTLASTWRKPRRGD